MAKAKIVIVSACNEFTKEQMNFIKRMMFYLQDHHKLSTHIEIKEKKIKHLKLKAS